MTQGREVELAEGEVSLGRSQSANVTIKDVSVSRNHAMIHARDGRLTVKDLNSSNGTFLNGMRIFAEAELHDGDHLTLGESELTVRIEAPESVAATMRIDPRALLAGEELRLQAQEEAQAALAAPGSPAPPAAAIPFRSPAGVAPPRPAAVAMPPLVSGLPSAALSVPASPAASTPAPIQQPPIQPAPIQLPPIQPAAEPLFSTQPAPSRPEPAAAPAPAMPPAAAPHARQQEALAALPPLPALEPAPSGIAPAAPPAPAASEAWGLPDIDLPPLPPIEATKPGVAPRATGARSPVASPAAPAVQLQPAGFWIRVAAALLDSVWILVLCAAAWFLTGSVLDDEQRWVLLGVLYPLLALGAAWVGWSIWGATPGKSLLGLHVCLEGSNSPGIGFGKGVLRVIGYALSSVAGVGFLMVAFTKGKRGLHDMIAGTYVGRRKK